MYEKDFTPGEAGKGSNITRHTAYNGFKRDQKEIEDKQSDQAKSWQGKLSWMRIISISWKRDTKIFL
jgi:hypothetical protein